MGYCQLGDALCQLHEGRTNFCYRAQLLSYFPADHGKIEPSQGKSCHLLPVPPGVRIRGSSPYTEI